MHDAIPATLVCDAAVSALLQTGRVQAVVVGADRVAANGDTANKIGTYQVRRHDGGEGVIHGRLYHRELRWC